MSFLAASSTTNVMGAFTNLQQCFCQFSWRRLASQSHHARTIFKHQNLHPPLILSSKQFSTCDAFNTKHSDGSGSGRWSRNVNRAQSTEEGREQSTTHKSEFKTVKKIKRGGGSNPTVFYDSLRVFVKAGTGGRGLPSKGGMGGKGGDVIVIGHKDVDLKKINELYPTRRFSASPGSDSRVFCLNGEPGKNILLPVPLGVSVVSDLGHVLGEVNKHAEKLVVAKGGVGGSPSNGFFAEEGQHYNISLDLKLIADVGFVGFPNAGKSTLLKALSRASPKIASYPFTTLRPNLGIIEYSDFRKISLADLPGLIEGAHVNIGMGHKFLKHVERTKVLLFVVDIHGFQLGPEYPKRSALETIVLLNKELELYKEELTEKSAILALNKMDLPGSFDIINRIRDTLSDEKEYENFLRTLPEEFWPENVMLFDAILPISAAKDPISVEQLKRKLRKVIDINEGFDNFGDSALMTTSTLPTI